MDQPEEAADAHGDGDEREGHDEHRLLVGQEEQRDQGHHWRRSNGRGIGLMAMEF